MGQSEIKIRALPRTGEKPKEQRSESRFDRRAVQMTVGILLIAMSFAMGYWAHQSAVTEQSRSLASKGAPNPAREAVQKYLHEVKVKEQLMKTDRDFDAQTMRPKSEDLSQLAPWPEDPNRTYGVQMDGESTADRIYQELNDDKYDSQEILPADRINARLARQRWITEYERQERINYIRNFIRTAYEQGYEVELDQNLKVVGVKKVNKTIKVNIDQIVERLAQQGR